MYVVEALAHHGGVDETAIISVPLILAGGL